MQAQKYTKEGKETDAKEKHTSVRLQDLWGQVHNSWYTAETRFEPHEGPAQGRETMLRGRV